MYWKAGPEDRALLEFGKCQSVMVGAFQLAGEAELPHQPPQKFFVCCGRRKMRYGSLAIAL
jgi:hypothetical protein